MLSSRDLLKSELSALEYKRRVMLRTDATLREIQDIEKQIEQLRATLKEEVKKT